MGLEQISGFFVDNLVLMIVVIYMAMMIAIGYFVQRKGADKSAENYLIANKGVGPLMVGGTVFSTTGAAAYCWELPGQHIPVM